MVILSVLQLQEYEVGKCIFPLKFCVCYVKCNMASFPYKIAILCITDLKFSVLEYFLPYYYTEKKDFNFVLCSKSNVQTCVDVSLRKMWKYQLNKSEKLTSWKF